MNTNILLVDSVSSYREEVALQLEQLGYHAVETNNGEEALKVLQEKDFDLVVVDNDLSDRTGLELIPQIRDFDKAVQLMLVVDPFDNNPERLKITNKNQVSQLVNGPLSPQALVREVESILTEQKVSSKPAKPQTGGEKPSSEHQKKNIDKKTHPSAKNEEDSLNAHVKAVRRSYQEKLPTELAKLEKALNKSKNKGGTRESLEEAHRIAHTLHGTSGTLGFDEVSELTGFIDSELKKMLAGSPITDKRWAAIFRYFKRAETVPERLSLVISVEPHTNNIATVLVADPDPKSLMQTSQAAHRRCIDVRGATSVEELEAVSAQGGLDGAIIDVSFEKMLPIVQVVEILRTSKGYSKLPIAMMSDKSSVENRVASAHAGASHFMQKPLDSEELANVVQHFVSSRAEQNYRVLIVDDDEPFREHVAAILKNEGFQVVTLGEPQSILEIAESVKPDILLLDVMMPQISGFDVCRMLRSTSSWKEIPILFLTAEADPKVRLECFRAGGDDYIKKPALKEELLARIGVRLERIRLYKERADKDALTTLPTRGAFIEMFKMRIAEGLRYHRAASLCLLDIDRFKHVNDTYGHMTGDQVLASLGQLLGSRFRAVDIRGRWGGEEFTIVFYGEDLATSKMILGRVLEEFGQIEFKGEHGESFNCTFSCGIAELPIDGTSAEELFRVADERLYRAKEAGRNRIVIS